MKKEIDRDHSQVPPELAGTQIGNFFEMTNGEQDAWKTAFKQARAIYLNPENNHIPENVMGYMEVLRQVYMIQPALSPSLTLINHEITLMNGVWQMNTKENTEETIREYFHEMLAMYLESNKNQIPQASNDFGLFLGELSELTNNGNPLFKELAAWEKVYSVQNEAFKKVYPGIFDQKVMNQSPRNRPPVD